MCLSEILPLAVLTVYALQAHRAAAAAESEKAKRTAQQLLALAHQTSKVTESYEVCPGPEYCLQAVGVCFILTVCTHTLAIIVLLIMLLASWSCGIPTLVATCAVVAG